MTLEQAIQAADSGKPNAFDDDTKTAWINEVEGLVQTEVFLLAPVEIIRYDWKTDQKIPLLVDPPHDKLYPAYLAAKIDFANGEYEKYANTYQMSNAFYNEFAAWFAQFWQPADAWLEGMI